MDKSKIDEAYNRLCKFCLYRLRSEKEILLKCDKLKLTNPEAEKMLSRLKQEGFHDEKQFAKAFTNDHYKLNHWGKRKIRYHLQNNNVNKKYIDDAINQIDNDEYMATAVKLLQKKMDTFAKLNAKTEQKCKQYLYGVGFEVKDIITAMTIAKKQI